jgi:hypothetical protein
VSRLSARRTGCVPCGSTSPTSRNAPRLGHTTGSRSKRTETCTCGGTGPCRLNATGETREVLPEGGGNERRHLRPGWRADRHRMTSPSTPEVARGRLVSAARAGRPRCARIGGPASRRPPSASRRRLHHWASGIVDELVGRVQRRRVGGHAHLGADESVDRCLGSSSCSMSSSSRPQLATIVTSSRGTASRGGQSARSGGAPTPGAWRQPSARRRHAVAKY